MTRFLDVLLGVLITAALLAQIGYAYAWQKVTANFARTYDVPMQEFILSGDPAVIAEGRHQARIRGCLECHGENLEGYPYFVSAKRGIKSIAPNLTLKAREYTPTEMARTIRHGIRPDGTSLQAAMPAFAFYQMTDSDLTALISFIYSMPVKEEAGLEGEFSLWPLGYLRVANGALPPNVAELIDHTAARTITQPVSGSVEHGRYIVESMCVECHSDNGRLRLSVAPNLQIAKAYNKENLTRLLRSGRALGDREINSYMVEVAKLRFKHMKDAEIDALYNYFEQM
ncbi:MAG: c-type cytochrome [Gammaproteobacteria bacterium]|nr:c-type cytochrome [Gammaproteobacteria bacterium]